jgi:hypothetical protein
MTFTADSQFDDDGTIDVQVDTADVVEGLRSGPELFIQFFLGELLALPVPAFHVEVFVLLITFQFAKFALAIPRGHAKTTLVKLAIVYYYLFTPIRFIVYCSNTSPVAKDECRDIINLFDKPNFIRLFGRVKFLKEDGSQGLYIFQIGSKICILRALGAGQQVRGLNIDHTRPQLLVCDDAEDDENTATEDQRRKFKNWVYGALFKACARHSKIIWIGNLVSRHCLIGEFCESPDWHSVKYGCILEDGTPLWPGMFDVDYLRNDFREYQRSGMMAKWFAEMMNMPVPDGMGLIGADEIAYQPMRFSGDMQYGFITVDPAISKKSSADNTGIAVHGFVDEKWQIVEHVKEKLDVIELVNRTIDLCYKWNINVVGVETVAFQAALISIFKMVMVQREFHDLQLVELRANARKQERISAWAGWLKAKNYALTEGEIEVTTQLLQYDPTKDENDDDLIDACAYGPQMITEHMNLIMAGWLQAQHFVSRNLDQLSEV